MQSDFGEHYLVDFFDCDRENIELVEVVQPILVRAARDSRAVIVGERFHQFEPVGVSGILLIAESHFSIHTWPEDRFAGVDIFTCGDEMDADVAIDLLTRSLGAGRVEIKVMLRGRLEGADMKAASSEAVS